MSAVAVLAAGSLLAAVGLSACGRSAAHAATVLRDPRAVTVQLADGRTRPATDGMTVPRGATVRTAAGGSASLLAAGRTVLLGQGTAVTVVDGARESLRAGLVMVDARHAAGLGLDAGSAVVQTPTGALARVERGVLLRVGTFRKTVVVRAAGRKAVVPVPALHQVQVADGSLPGDPTPLALTRDSWERRYALDLVTADLDLVSLADGLDHSSSGAALLRALPASYQRPSADLPDLPAGSRGDAALAVVVARAAHTRGDAAARYAQVRTLRDAGGSWGVVAALVGADVAAVSAALDAALAPAGGTPVLASGATGGGGAVPPGLLLGGPSAPTGTSPGGSGGGTSGGGTSGGRPRPSPSPSPSGGTVQTVVDTVTHLLPTPLPTPTTVSTVPVQPSPSPSPLLTVQLPGVGLSVG